MKRVISFALFGNVFSRSAWHWHWLPSLIRGYISLFPGWELWFYHDDNLYSNYYGSVLLNLQELGLVKLIYVPEKPILCKAMQWRMKPLWEKDVEYFLCRDVDHIPTGRERQAVEAFISSGMLLHCINDNAAHSTPMMGGMVGFKVNQVREIIRYNSFEEYISSLQFSDEKWATMGADQEYLYGTMWSLLKPHSCLHRSGWHQPEPESKHCYFNIPLINVNDVPAEVISRSNDFCNFIGTPTRERDGYIKFMDDNGPKDKIELIKKLEKIAGSRIDVSYNLTNQFSVNSKKVVLACDTNADYYFFLPLVSLAWQQAIGYCPVVLAIGSKEFWLSNKLSKFVLDESRKFGAEIYFIDSMEGHRNSTLAQVSRLYASRLGYASDTYLLTSDTDLFPLSRDFFNKQDPTKKVHLFYGNAYNKEKFPISCIGADVTTWNQVMCPPETDDIREAISWQLDNGLGRGADHWAAWNYDELLFGRRLFVWDTNLSKCQIIERCGAPPVDRIWPSGKGVWNFNGSIVGKVDSHLGCMGRPGYSEDNWPTINQMLKCLLPNEFHEWITRYCDRFIQVKKET